MSIDRRWPRGRVLHWIGVCGAATLSMSIAQGQENDSRWLHNLLNGAVDSVIAERTLGIDPALRRRIVSEANTMVSNFCLPAEQLEKCRRSFTPALIRSEVGRYVAQLEAGRPEVRLIAANLAIAIGNDLAQIGWPPQIANDVGIVALPEDAKRGRVLLSTASGTVEIARSASTLLMLQGTYSITIDRDGAGPTGGQVDVAGRTRTSLAVGGSRSEAGTFGRLDPPDDSFCFNSGQVRFEGAVGMYNWGRAVIAESANVKRSNLSPTATSAAVNVQVDDSTGACQGVCLRALGVAFAEAITTWKVGCERCDQNAMSVLTVAGTTWVDGRIANRLRASMGTVPLDLKQRVDSEFARSVLPSVVPTRTAVYGFEQLSGNASLVRAACALQSAEAPWVPAVRAGVCGAPWSNVDRISPVLSLVSGSTSCGSSEAFIACGHPNKRIELSLERDSYQLTTVQPTLRIGASGNLPPIDLRAVLLHEVGHWFGVPHFDKTGMSDADIMADTLGDGRTCVSAVSLIMLNNASDLRWPYRIAEEMGLRRPRTKAARAPAGR